MKIFEKYKKLIIICLPIFIFLSGGLLIKYNLPKVVEFILKITIGPTISSQEIKFPKFGEIDITDVVLSKGDDTIVKAPRVVITYSKESLKNFRLKEINVQNPWVHIERKGESVNIVDAFSSSDKKENSPSKAGTAVPIDIITVKNAHLLFRDTTYSREIKQELDNVNGYVSFNKKTGIDLEFKGNNKKEIYEYRLNNLNEPLNMNIILKNIQVNPELIQYGYDDKDISGAKGLFNMNLTIATSGLTGEAELKNGTVIYDGLSNKVENVNGIIDFKKDKINVNFKYDLEKNPGTFDVFYSEKTGVKVDFKFKDISYKVIKSYKLLGDLNLPLDNLKFKNVDVSLSYEKEKGFKAEIDYNGYPFEASGVNINNVNGKVVFENGILTLAGNKLNILVPGLEYKRDLTYKADLDLTGENLKFNVNSNFIKLQGEYDKKAEILNLYQEKKLVLSYNLKTQTLELIDLQGSNLLGDYDFFLQAHEKDKIINFDEISMVNKDGQKVLQITGDLNKENLKYQFKIHTRDLKEKSLFSNLNLDTDLDFIGEVAGEKEKFILRGVVKDFKLKNEDLYLDSYANISVVNDKGIQVNVQGELREGRYKKFKIQGIKIDATYDNGKFMISDVRNALFKVNGEVDILNKNIDLSYKINGLKSSEFEKSSVVLILDNVQGEIAGGFDNYNINANVKEAFLEMPNKELIFLNGEINYKDNTISTNNFKINQSVAAGEYNLKDKSGQFTLNILEENLAKYYDFKALKYRVLSRVVGNILDGEIEVRAGINIDRVYLNGDIMPNLTSSITYIKNSQENTLSIDELDIINLEGKRILFSSGNVNLIEKTIDFRVPNQSLYLKDLQGILNVRDMSGSIGIESEVNGDLEDPQYSLKLFDGEYEIKGFDFDKISLNLVGDKRKIKIEELLAYYEKNMIKGEGEYDILSKNYKFNIFSKNIDLSFLNAILSKDNIRNIEGTANIDIQLSSNLKENSGYIDLINFNADLPKVLLNLKGLNMVLKVDNERLTINSLEGKLNDGDIKGRGYLKLPTIEEIKADDEFYKNLDYAFNITLKNMIYQLKDYFKIDLSTNLVYSENKISGNVIINNGEIVGILKEDKGLILTILNFIIDKTRAIIGESKKLGEDFEIKGVLNETPEFDIGVMIKDGININIPDVSTFAQDVKGLILGRFNVVGKNEKIGIVGELEIQKGSFVLGSEDFTVTRALLLADKKNGLISDFNPNLIFDVSALTANGNIEISLQGELNSLRLNIVTSQGSESSSLKNLFDESGEGGDKSMVALLFKTLIDSQISSTLLRPISRTIQNVFHISKFRIVSDVFNQEVLANSDNPKVQDPNVFGFGAYLEAENPIYKDKYFWILKLGIIDGSKYDIGGTDSESQSNEFSNSVNQLDFKIERRYKSGWSYGIGAAKLNDANMIEKKKKGKLNYYIDFKFEKKYNSIKDIFSNKK
ncbi:hypothetical protein NON08_08300 [Cetobacterium somerae]|uniref:hypothetical protein n=1 Tax=Cetobacterium sp. NK01 TaxID=2993530 RepID=UPI0021171367|nr:hypothetical protein [Cetobacterium sp. NK01]MCQ8212520.1 hypothetical protein [Cetobacterium sp. NK01]